MKLQKWGYGVCLALLVCVYIALRIPSILHHSVAYTYDQGRDFIKAAQMIESRRPTFIGPTTGINGLNHGAWWYYVLGFAFLLVKGSPIGFYWFNFFLHLLSFAILILYLRKKNELVSIFLAALIAFSPYFVGTSVFVGNNIMVLPSLLLFLLFNFEIISGKKIPQWLSVLGGLLLGLICEFELSFGFFILPVYFFGIFIFPKLRKYFKSIRTMIEFILGLTIAFFPRILFELKNNFIQTKILIAFITKPKLFNPKPFTDVLIDRSLLFYGYWKSIFPNDYWTLLFSVLFILFIVYLSFRKKLNETILFPVYLVLGLFVISLLYKDNFWSNYYEGIQYIVVLLMAYILVEVARIHKTFTNSILISTIIVFSVTNFYLQSKTFGKEPKLDGLAKHEKIIGDLLTKTAGEQFCLRIYTPPIHPYTYSYLLMQQKKTPQSEWINGTCWFIVESDSFTERRKNWLDTNSPKSKHTVIIEKMQDVELQFYKVEQSL